MSIPERIVRISKAYLNQVKDRIDASLTEQERRMAEDELADAVEGESRSGPATTGPSSRPAAPRAEEYSTDPEALMRRAEERIAAARRAAESAAELSRALDQAEGRTSGIGTESGARRPAATQPPLTPEQENDPNATEYRILGVPIGSDLATVQAAYEKLARRCDPRRFPDNSSEKREAERILVRVNASYETLRKRLDPTENRFGKLELE